EPGGGVALVGVERRELALRLYLGADQSCRTDELPPVEAARWGVAAAMSLRVGDLAGVDTHGPVGGRRPDSDHERRGGIRDGVPGVLAGGATACRTRLARDQRGLRGGRHATQRSATEVECAPGVGRSRHVFRDTDESVRLMSSILR